MRLKSFMFRRKNFHRFLKELCRYGPPSMDGIWFQTRSVWDIFLINIVPNLLHDHEKNFFLIFYAKSVFKYDALNCFTHAIF